MAISTLIDYQDSCLVIIDVQKVFLDKLSDEEREPLVQRILWLTRVSIKMDIPLIVTAEDMDRNGSVISALEEILPTDTKIHNKMVFGLADDPSILGYVQNTKRKTIILIGLETDVCVAHSAIGLMEHDYQVVVVDDATASPGKAHQYGISRIKSAGALISNVKSLFYEWMRTVDRYRDFYQNYEEFIGEPGIGL